MDGGRKYALRWVAKERNRLEWSVAKEVRVPTHLGEHVGVWGGSI
jgi:hypothetical protein